MGNCQTAEAATVVIQHPGSNGKVERLYWPTTAEQVMKSNPGHHVTRCITTEGPKQRVKLLKPNDVLLIGQVYHLIPSKEVSRAMKARKLEKIKKAQNHDELMEEEQRKLIQNTRVDDHSMEDGQKEGKVKSNRLIRQEVRVRKERNGKKNRANSGARAQQWQPKLQSISEYGR